MNFKSLRWFVACLVGAAGVVVTGRAQALQMAPAQKQEMMEHYERATRAYDIQKYQEAIEEYQKAYEIAGDPAMLYNVAQAYRLNGQLSEALHSYRRYLQRSPNARNRDDVERKIADLDQTIEARRRKAEADAAASARRTAPPVASTSVVTPPPTPPPAAPPPSVTTTETPTNKMRVAGIVFVSVGAAALVAAGVSGLIARKKGDDLSKDSMNGVPFDPDIEKSGHRWDAIAIGSAIGGGALAVVGTILLIVSGSDGEEKHGQGSGTALLTPVVGAGALGMRAVISF